jgi:hypothetical protein
VVLGLALLVVQLVDELLHGGDEITGRDLRGDE